MRAAVQVTSQDSSSSFVLHVPREYDYLYTATNAGIAVDADGQAAEYAIKARTRERTVRQLPLVRVGVSTWA